jgi:glycosyltransferase involved in cell wall biosynthesis
VKILFLNATAAVGGAERVLLDLMASLRRCRPDLELRLALPGAGPLASLAEELGVRVHLLPLPVELAEFGDSGLRGRGRWRAALDLAGRGTVAGWAAWQSAARLRRLVAAVRPALVHSNSLKFHLLTWLARLPGTAVVWHQHDFAGQRPLLSRLLRWAAGAATGVVAVSRAVAEDVRALLPGRPVEVVYNAVDTDRFSPGPGDGRVLDELAGLAPAGPDAVRVGLVATYARWKGHEVFLEAATRLAGDPAGKALRFYVVGGPIYQTRGSQWSAAELRARAAPLPAAGRLGFVPFQPEPAAAYRALDVVVHASTRPEPFGLTIAEAMACGRAVIAAGSGGAAELVRPGHDAAAVPPGDAAALAREIATLAASPDLRRRLGENARRTAVQRFDRGRLGGEFLAAYRALGVRGAGPGFTDSSGQIQAGLMKSIHSGLQSAGSLRPLSVTPRTSIPVLSSKAIP